MVSPQFSRPELSIGGPGLGLLFTDARGRVIFLDNWVLAQLGHVEVGELVGEPLHTVFGVSQAAADALLKEISHEGYIHDRPLAIARPDGAQIEMVCTGIANYDDQRIFIGADVTLREPNGAFTEQPATHGDVLAMRIQRIQAEADARQMAKDGLQAQLYLSALIDAVHVLLARTGGQRVAHALEDILNLRATQSSWPVKMTGGAFVFTSADVPPEAYQKLIYEAIGYARNVVGGRLLLQEMHALDDQMEPEVRHTAGWFGLRGWVG